MGTSSPFGGPGNHTPLLPDWADDDMESSPDDEPGDDNDNANDRPSSTDDNDDNQPPETGNPDNSDEGQKENDEKQPEQAVDPLRFRMPRGNFTRYVTSNGTDTNALGRAIQGYVSKGVGGSRNAARKMTGSRKAAGSLLNILRDVQTKGLREVLRTFSLESLTGKSPKEILAAFTDIVCSPGGTIDEAIARDAYVETIIDISTTIEDLGAITEDQVNVILTQFITRSIITRIFIDIGMTLDFQTISGENANYLSQAAFGFVLGLVQDRLMTAIQNTRSLDAVRMNSAMNKIYEIGFRQLQNEINAL